MIKKIKSFDEHILENLVEDIILNKSPHRSWEMPKKEWSYYQEWNRDIFMHWEVSYDDLRPLVPSELEIDSFEGTYWVSIVAFTMEKIRPAYLPSFSPISNFHEINVRTYIKDKNKSGVYFLNIEAEKVVSAFLSRKLSGLPYEKSDIRRGNNFYKSSNSKKGFELDVEFEIGPRITEKTPLMIWLTERYSLYLEEDGEVYLYEIQHQEWDINEIEIGFLKTNYIIGNLDFNREPDLVQYSPGVKVLAWGSEKI